MALFCSRTLLSVHKSHSILMSCTAPVAVRSPDHYLCLLKVMNFMNKLAGNEYVGFSNATWVQIKRIHNLWLDENLWSGHDFSEKFMCSTGWVVMFFPVPVSSRSESPETETLPSATTWRKRRCVLQLHSPNEKINDWKIQWLFCIWVMMMMLLLSFQCFPEGTDMTSILDFYFQVKLKIIFVYLNGPGFRRSSVFNKLVFPPPPR